MEKAKNENKEIERLFGNFDTQLTTITGIGTTLAATIFSEIGGNLQRFSESGKLAAFAGNICGGLAGYLACLNRCCL